MKRFIKHTLLFLLPVLIYGTTVRYLDPFNYFGNSHFSKATQMDYAYPVNRTLYRMVQFSQTDKNKLLIGDSRMNYIGALTDTAHTAFFNFSSGGASMYQMVDVFNYAVSQRPINEVVFQVSFDDFNEQQDYSEIDPAKAILENKLLYIYNISNLKVLYYILADKLTGKQPSIGVVKTDKDRYWEECLKKERDFHTGKNYVYAGGLKKKLKTMVNYCQLKGIKLTFVLLPVHNNVLQIIKAENGNNYQRFKQDIAQIMGNALFIDMSEMQVINNKEAFSDPYHLSDDTTRLDIFNRITNGY